MTDTHASTSPVHALRLIGEFEYGCDYLALGLNASHITELIDLVKEQSCTRPDEPLDETRDREDCEKEDAAWFASIHAWVALGQLQDLAAAPVLIAQLPLLYTHDVDWVDCLLPTALAAIGAEVYPLLCSELHNHPLSDTGEHADYRHILILTLCRVAHSTAALTTEATTLVTQELAQCTDEQGTQWQAHAETYNTELIEHLITLKAVDSIDVIRTAYAQVGAIDPSWFGGINEIEQLLGIEKTATNKAQKKKK